MHSEREPRHLMHDEDVTGTAKRDRPTGLGQTAKVADSLRDAIIEGRLAPGSRLSEEALVKDLGVSRNTLREAFRLLSHDGLLIHRFNRGVFIPELDIDDLIDLYRLRRLIEPYVVRSLTSYDRHRLTPLRDAVEAAEHASDLGQWPQVITANMRFHQALVALADSPRLNTLLQRLLAEMRLIFAVVGNPQPLYEPYVAQNRYLYQGIADGKFEEMAQYLEQYLHESETALHKALTSARMATQP